VRTIIIDDAVFDLRADRVSFRYRGRSSAPALTDVSVALDQRPTVLIGPNGAGKSTLLKLLTGSLRPSTGTVNRTGRIGWAPQHTPALPGFTVADQVRYASWLAGVRTADTVRAAEQALSRTDLTELAGRAATRLSGGELARLGIACALAPEPSVLLLDEPTASLDPLARRSVSTVLRALAEQGVGILVSSHTASDIGAPFTRLLVLDRGRLAFDGSVRDFFATEHPRGVVADLAQALRER
jgi:ABC-type multidrug transport system ATPase subunit